MGYKSYSDSYLMSLTKAQIIELLRVTEHNFLATEEALNNSAKAGMEIAKRYDEANRLLKSATNVLKRFKPCDGDYDCSECIKQRQNCDYDDNFKWRYAAEALALIGEDGEQNG